VTGSGAQATSPSRRPAQWWARLGLSARILVGLALGVLCGLFFGEGAGLLQPVADIYIRLMQMMVLPYLVVALVLGIGQLDPAQAKRLAWGALALLLVFCAVALAVVGLMPLAFPAAKGASFFSHALLETRAPISIADLYVPANPFHALANSLVPAIVLFSTAVGVALIGAPGKDSALAGLRVASTVIVRVMSFVVNLTPIGVFAISAVAAGTMTLEEFARLQVYFVTFAVASLLIGFVVIPLIVATVTPLRYGEIVAVARDALLTAFVANSAFIVLPILVERAKELLQRRGLLTEAGASGAEVAVPILFNLPNAGRLLTVLFVPFTAWLADAPLAAGDYPSLAGAALFSYFAKAQIALPFLMDLAGVPHDYFQLYIPTTIVTGKFDSLVAAMNLLAFALLAGCAAGGCLSVDPRRIARAAAVIAGATLVSVVGTRALLGALVDTRYHKDEVLAGMQLLRSPVPVVVHRTVPPQPGADRAAPALERIRLRGTLRVGYNPDMLPFSFFNARGELVGFDVELAGLLARDLGVTALELIPADLQALPALLNAGDIDVVMTLPFTVYWIRAVRYSQPYIDGVMALAVRDERRHEFATIDALRDRKGLTLGVPASVDFMRDRFRDYIRLERVRVVAVASPREFFEGRRPDIDALLTRAEVGAAWSLVHPDYTVVIPQPGVLKAPTGAAVALDAEDLATFVNEWLAIQRAAGTIERAYGYWILGRGAEHRHPRWSIVRDVLGWTP
jgi:Na+/H+-dicarboxylate symporter